MRKGMDNTSGSAISENRSSVTTVNFGLGILKHFLFILTVHVFGLNNKYVLMSRQTDCCITCTKGTLSYNSPSSQQSPFTRKMS